MHQGNALIECLLPQNFPHTSLRIHRLSGFGRLSIHNFAAIDVNYLTSDIRRVP